MFFCSNCNNTFDIIKGSTIKTKNLSGGSNEQELFSDSFTDTSVTTPITSLSRSGSGGELDYEDIIKKILNSESITLDKFDLNNFIKSGQYKKLSSKDKEIVYNTIQDLLPKDKKRILESKDEPIDDSKAYFICNNCGFTKPIEPQTQIFSKRSEVLTQEYGMNGYKNMLHSDILPHTRKYICPNNSCISHTDINKREAVFFRQNNSYAIKYICKACGTDF